MMIILTTNSKAKSKYFVNLIKRHKICSSLFTKMLLLNKFAPKMAQE